MLWFSITSTGQPHTLSTYPLNPCSHHTPSTYPIIIAHQHQRPLSPPLSPSHQLTFSTLPISRQYRCGTATRAHSSDDESLRRPREPPPAHRCGCHRLPRQISTQQRRYGNTDISSCCHILSFPHPPSHPSSHSPTSSPPRFHDSRHSVWSIYPRYPTTIAT